MSLIASLSQLDIVASNMDESDLNMWFKAYLISRKMSSDSLMHSQNMVSMHSKM